jgi:iron(III) transport system permease protein
LAFGVLALLALAAMRGDARVLSLGRNTLVLTAGTLALALPLGTLLAVLLVRTDLPLRRCGLLLVSLGLFVPLYVQAGAWMAGFGLQGWYTLSRGTEPWIAGMRGAIWIHAAAAIPWIVLIVGAGLWLVEPEIEEQGLLDAAPADVLWKVTLPGAAGAVWGAALWTVLGAACEMTVTDLLVVRTFAEEIYTQASATGEPLGAPWELAHSVLLAALVVLAALAGVATVSPRPVRPPNRPRVVFSLGPWRWPALGAVAAALAILVGLPLSNLIYKAGMIASSGPAGLERSWSATKCLRLAAEALLRHDASGFRPGRVLHELGWTLAVGALAATLALVLAAPLAWLARRERAWAWPAWLAVALGLAVPGTLVGVALAWLFNRPAMLSLYDLAGFDLYGQSIIAPVLAQALRALPLTALVLWHALGTVPQSGVDVARLEGAGPIRRMVSLGLAARKPAVATAWLVALAVSTGELSASLLVAPARVQLLTRWIYNQLHYGQEDLVASAMLVVLSGYALLAGGCLWAARKWLSSEE